MSLHLISFKTCPFVQRAIITLKHKNIDFEVTYIDLGNPPDWFLEISPMGKVPVLKVEGIVLFESAVINEYLDEVTGSQLQPADPLKKALNKSWIEVASQALGNLYMMKMAKNQEKYDKYRNSLTDLLVNVENALGDGPWFNGEAFSLVDTSFAPLFTQNSVADGKLSMLDAEKMSKLTQWSEKLLALPEVKHSTVEEFESLCIEAMRDNNSYALFQLANYDLNSPISQFSES
ncbi:MAG: glutathione S-transferase [Gammaproteobacteria bacterium]|jgi:glutathione S-transferase